MRSSFAALLLLAASSAVASEPAEITVLACGCTDARLAVSLEGVNLPGERARVECLPAR